MSSEEWRPVEEFPSYEVSSLGRIRNRKGLLALHTREDGYVMCNLYRNGVPSSFRLNRLVCRAFNGAPTDPEALALHKDHDRSNNTASNLYWGTQQQNMADRNDADRGNYISGEKASWSKLNWDKVRIIRQKRKEGSTIAALAKEFGVSNASIVNICANKAWKE